MTEELKACPFCGASPKLVQQTVTLWSVECDGCDAGSGWAEDMHSPVRAWNRRAPDARDARIAELEAKLASNSPHDPGQAALATLQGMGYEHRGGVLWAPPVREMATCGCGDQYPAGSWDAGFIAALGHCANCAAALDPVTPEPTPSTPWYPDDSGEWVEVPEGLMEMPSALSPETRIEGLTRDERE